MLAKRNERSERPELNAGSMADIAFLLLIFFLVTTTMESEVGIHRLLAPLSDDGPPIEALERDVLVVLIDDTDVLFVEGRRVELSELRPLVKDFMTNPERRVDLPELIRIDAGMVQQGLVRAQQQAMEARSNPEGGTSNSALELWEEKQNAVELLGAYDELPPNAVISLTTSTGSSYRMYVGVQNEIEAAIAELRDALSLRLFGHSYADLSTTGTSDQGRIWALRTAFPQRISEETIEGIDEP